MKPPDYCPIHGNFSACFDRRACRDAFFTPIKREPMHKPMYKYTLYTEAKSNLPNIVGRLFDSFTILQGTGYWKGQAESCAVIVILHPEPIAAAVGLIVADILRINKQSAVLVETAVVAAAFISAEG